MKKLYPIFVLVIVIAALIAISTTSSQEDNGKIGYIFSTLSDAGTNDEGMHHQIFMTGLGAFDNEIITGGGVYNHWDAATGAPAAGEPFHLVSSGTWQAERVINWTQTDSPQNPYGEIMSGTLEMEIRLFPVEGPEDGILATLTVNCNIAPAGLFTGLAEGFYIELDGMSFEPAVFPETTFNVGLTAFLTNGGD